MKTLSVILLLFGLFGCASARRTPAPATSSTTTANPVTGAADGLYSGMRQMTFEGSRSGEGYFSRDGRYMVFQSEREKGNPFYQIYLMDLKTGLVHRVSPGKGKTTCSWIHPDEKHILFSSTHADPKLKQKVAEELESRKHPSHYSWSFDDAFDIYQSDFDGHHLKNLTHTPGYDAEGSYSPDGKWIAFASNRLAYTGKMTDEERAGFERDPSYMMDIYIMRADGRDVKRLTTMPGYDGGPFFSPDGQRLTFRHFAPNGMTAEIYTMKTDGTDLKQLTHLNAISWASFYHPSGDYLIFASSKPGMSNFELYMVDSEGKHEPVRVTDLPGFDGLPVFTPDGRTLVWAHSLDKKETQIFRADWNDTRARELLGLKPPTPTAARMAQAVDDRDARTWVEYLASDRLQGRATGSTQEKEYLAVITRAFGDMGLKPVGGSFLQEYEFTSGIELQAPNELEMQISGVTRKLKVGTDWMPLSYSATGKFESASLVFAGYGIVAPAQGPTQPAYDSYGDLDVKGKWVVVFNGLPEDVGNDRRFQLHTYSRIEHKAMMARDRGARGLIVVDDSETPASPMALKMEGRGEEAGLPVLRLSAEVAERLFTGAKTTREEWTKKLASGDTATLDLNGANAQARIGLHLKRSTAHNALAELEVPGATGTIVIGAHGDHLGHGEMGNSLWRGEPKNAIHHGADDNASGVAGVMTIARALSNRMNRGELNLKQNIVFAVWTGEEIGVLGSAHFVNWAKKSQFPITAYLNMDMIGRYRDAVSIQGTGSAPQWKSMIEKIALDSELSIKTQDDPYLPSDSLSFYMKEIPTVMAFTGSHADYHTPKDTADKINYQGLARVADLVEDLAVDLASSAKSLVTYRKVEGGHKPSEGRGFRLYLGTVPDYTQEGKTGVVISGTTKNSPAEQAGLRAGDTIIELGGVKIKNIYDYVYCLQAMKANVKTPMKIVRDGSEKALEITPVLKVQ